MRPLDIPAELLKVLELTRNRRVVSKNQEIQQK